MSQLHCPHAQQYLAAAEDRRRLEAFAPLFDISFIKLSDDRYELTVQDDVGQRNAILPTQFAHLRLLAELCEKMLNWTYFHPGEHCALTVLSQPDSKIKRIAELYRIRKATDCPNDDVADAKAGARNLDHSQSKLPAARLESTMSPELAKEQFLRHAGCPGSHQCLAPVVPENGNRRTKRPGDK